MPYSCSFRGLIYWILVKFPHSTYATGLDGSFSKISISSLIYYHIPIVTLPSPAISMSILREKDLSPRWIINSPKIPATLATISSKTSYFNYENVLSSRYHQRIHCFPSTILLVTYLSYGFSSKPNTIIFNRWISYHKRAYSIQPYSALRNCIYRTLFQFLYHMFGMWFGSTSHMMSENSTFNLRNTTLSSGMSPFK